MALSGVRSSWLMLARNCDLCWLAISSWRLFSSISVKRCAFWIASTDCAAKVFMRSMVLDANAPGCLRRTASTPMTCSRQDGAGGRRRVRQNVLGLDRLATAHGLINDRFAGAEVLVPQRGNQVLAH